jgi:hypothetical protein
VGRRNPTEPLNVDAVERAAVPLVEALAVRPSNEVTTKRARKWLWRPPTCDAAPVDWRTRTLSAELSENDRHRGSRPTAQRSQG